MIRRLDVYPLLYEEPHYRGAERCVTLVRVEDDDGVVGWGEAISQFREASLAMKVLVEEGLGPLVVGEDPLEVERVWHKLCAHAYWYGVEGIAAFAISAIDMALWDLKGKRLGCPVASLLGGRLQDAVPAMASIIFDMEDLDWTLREFASFKDEGYRIVKAGWGMRPEAMFGMDAALDLRYLREIRATIGEEIALVVDTPGAKGLWTVPEAIRRLREWEEFDLRWVEQPLLPGDLEGYARLRAAATGTPVGTGEDEWSPETYKRVIDAGAADVLQLDVGRCLGLTGARETVKLIENAELSYTMHSWSGALNTAASLAVLAISRNGDTLDLKPHPSPMQHDLVEDPWAQQDGLLAVRDRPGLGVTIREDALERFALR